LATSISEADKQRAQNILEILRNNLTIREHDFASLLVARETCDPFRVLVVTILSQSCTDIAALRAYRELDERIGVTVHTIRNARVAEVQRTIRVAGLHHQKARALRRLAEVVAKQYSGDLKPLLDAPVFEARQKLQQLPKVGPKTADVLLSIWKRPTISVDTHVNRVAKRLGFAPMKAGYEEVRTALLGLYRKEDYHSIPLVLMAHGRQVCKARKPLCPKCPVHKLCPYKKKTKRI